MHSFVGLWLREWQEHRTAFVAAPAVVLGLILLAGISAITLNDHVDPDLTESDYRELEERLGEGSRDVGALEAITAMTLDAAGSTDAELEVKLDSMLDGIAGPFQIAFIIVAFFALIGSLHDERKDQSILFWKSMPVADWQTVASKATFVLWLAPIATIACILMAQLFAVTVSSAFVEGGMGGRIWTASEIWLRPVELISRYLIMSVWVLPLAAWAMLVSSAAPRLPILWVFGVPLVISFLEQIFFGSSALASIVSNHMQLWSSAGAGEGVQILGHIALLGEPRVWGGVVVGGLLLGATVWCRARLNET